MRNIIFQIKFPCIWMCVTFKLHWCPKVRQQTQNFQMQNLIVSTQKNCDMNIRCGKWALVLRRSHSMWRHFDTTNGHKCHSHYDVWKCDIFHPPHYCFRGIFIWWLHWEVTMTVALWGVARWRYNEITLWSHQNRCIVMNHPITSQWSHAMTLGSPTFKVSTVKFLLCAFPPDYFILMSLGNSSQSNNHADFTMESPNNAYMTVTRGHHCKVN